MLDLVIIGVYLVVLIAIGVINRRKARGVDDFFVAGRKSSTLFIAGSLIATIVGGSATVGMAGLGFVRGLTGAWWILVGSVGLVVLGLFLAKKVRQTGKYTLPELVQEQYDRRMALATSILIVISWIGIVAAQILASSRILGVLGIGSPVLWMFLFTAVFVLYTVIGGQYAVIGTDVVQAAVIFIGILAGLPLLLSRVGGWSGLSAALPADRFAFPVSSQFGGIDLVSLLLLVGLTYVVGPDMYSRIFCARDVRTARASVFWAALFLVPLAFAITLFGMGASVLFPQIAAEQAFPTVIKEVLPPFVGAIVLAALLSAVMSSADTCLLSASTILTVDVVGWFKPSLSPRRVLLISRFAIVVLGVGSLFLALFLKGIISSLLFAYTIYTAGVILPVLAGFYRSRLKVTPTGALVALIGGGLAALVSKIFVVRYLDIGALLISVVLLFAVSFIDNRINRKR
jgi:SSS family solute:Na+ symporter